MFEYLNITYLHGSISGAWLVTHEARAYLGTKVGTLLVLKLGERDYDARNNPTTDQAAAGLLLEDLQTSTVPVL